MTKDAEMMKTIGDIFSKLADNEPNHDYTADELREAAARYLEKHEFSIGQLVQWKPGLKNCKCPDIGMPGIIIDMELGRRDLNSTDNYEYAPSNIRIGVLLNGVLEGFWVDSNRFEPYTGD